MCKANPSAWMWRKTAVLEHSPLIITIKTAGLHDT